MSTKKMIMHRVSLNNKWLSQLFRDFLCMRELKSRSLLIYSSSSTSKSSQTQLLKTRWLRSSLRSLDVGKENTRLCNLKFLVILYRSVRLELTVNHLRKDWYMCSYIISLDNRVILIQSKLNFYKFMLMTLNSIIQLKLTHLWLSGRKLSSSAWARTQQSSTNPKSFTH